MEPNIAFWGLQAVNGLAYALLLFLFAAGFSLIFGLMNFLNLSHGSFFMFGAYLGISMVARTGSFWVALATVPLVVGGLAWLVERLYFRRLYRMDHLMQVVGTFGVVMTTMEVAKLLWGPDVQNLPTPASLTSSFSVESALFPAYRLFVIGVGLLLATLLWLGIERTLFGARIRAGVSDAPMLAALGENIDRLFTATFALSAALAALSGVVAGPILGAYPGVDLEVLLAALIIVVIGGMGSLAGAFWASILVGELDTFGRALFPDYSLFIIFVVMATTLVFRPTGLMGRGETA